MDLPTATQEEIISQASYIKAQLDNGYKLVLTSEEYKALPDILKGHKNIMVNTPIT